MRLICVYETRQMDKPQTIESEILDAVYCAIDAVNEMLPPESHVEKRPETVLFGTGGVLDSLGLMNLILTAEDRLSSAFDRSFGLAERVFGGEDAVRPATVADLASLVAEKLKETPGAN